MNQTISSTPVLPTGSLALSLEKIEIKSTGFLLDEYITAEMKMELFTIEGKPITEVEKRLLQLQTVIDRRKAAAASKRFTVGQLIGFLTFFNSFETSLRAVLRACWNAQEVTRNYKQHSDTELAQAGIEAQRTNAQRNILIRQIDELMDETEGTVLEKTYVI